MEILYKPMLYTFSTLARSSPDLKIDETLYREEKNIRKRLLHSFVDYKVDQYSTGFSLLRKPDIAFLSECNDVICISILEKMISHYKRDFIKDPYHDDFFITLGIAEKVCSEEIVDILLDIYTEIDMNHHMKVQHFPSFFNKIDLSKLPQAKERILDVLKDTFNSIKNLSSSNDGWIDAIDGDWHKFSDEERKAVEDKRPVQIPYWPLVNIYTEIAEKVTPLSSIPFLVELFTKWRPMYVRHHAFLRFSELTKDVKYATVVANTILGEPEMDSRTTMLEWLQAIDYTESPEIAKEVNRIAVKLSNNPCCIDEDSDLIMGTKRPDRCGNDARLYIGNDTAIPDVKKAATRLVEISKSEY